MNQKFNWRRGKLTNAAGVGIPVRFNTRAGFEVKIKNSRGNGMDLDGPLVPAIFDLRAQAGGVEALVSLALFKRSPALASMTLSEIMLDERRLAAVLKARKKRS
jgi:hypothetical protein